MSYSPKPTSPKLTALQPMAAKVTRLPVPNRHIVGQGHHRSPQKH